jgi:flavin reductase (DIM6/NTAB) family NADH-FMN oxidoreductase RutF
MQAFTEGEPDQKGTCAATAYRTLMSSFPTGVTVVTAADDDGRPWGLTCSSLASVTVDPPTLLVCLTSRSPVLAVVRRSGHFAVNLLHARARSTAQLFATPMADRFARVAWQPSGTADLPHLVDDAFAVADCRVVGDISVGDHTILLGEAEQISHDADQPLLYGMRRFALWPSATTVGFD